MNNLFYFFLPCIVTRILAMKFFFLKDVTSSLFASTLISSIILDSIPIHKYATGADLYVFGGVFVSLQFIRAILCLIPKLLIRFLFDIVTLYAWSTYEIIDDNRLFVVLTVVCIIITVTVVSVVHKRELVLHYSTHFLYTPSNFVQSIVILQVCLSRDQLHEVASHPTPTWTWALIPVIALVLNIADIALSYTKQYEQISDEEQ